MAMAVSGYEAGPDGLILFIDGAAVLFERMRAGESYTVLEEWDGERFALEDPLGARVEVRERPGGNSAPIALELATPPDDFEERAEWYMRIGFAFADETFEDGAERRLLEAGPVALWIVESETGSATFDSV